MSTKKRFAPEEIRHLRANPYTRCVTAGTISYTLAFKEAFWVLSLQGYTGPAAFRKPGYNTEVLGFERVHNTTKRIRREAKSLEGLHEDARGGVRLQKEATPVGSPSLAKPPDGCGGRSCASSSRWRFKKVMKLHDGPEK